MAQHRELQCGVHRLTYDFATLSGELFMLEGHCCDMSGCISIFEKIDPNVKQIQTYSGLKTDGGGQKRDTRYYVWSDVRNWRSAPPEWM